MNKKIFTIMIIFIFICSLSFVSASDNNDTVLSVSESDNMLSISSDNVSYPSGNDDVIGNSIESDDVLSDGEIATKLHVTPSKEGIIEDDSVVLNITLTDENDNPIERGDLKYYINNVVGGNLDINNGTAQYTLKRTSGFYYFYCVYNGLGQYASSQSNNVEVIFANDNTMTDLAVRMILADGELDLTKDFTGYGSNKVTRRNVDDYSQVLVQYEKLNEGIPVSGSFTINGNGHKIDASGNYLSRCFFIVSGGTFTLNDLILSNGYGGVSANHLITYKNQPTINLNNVTLKDSYAASSFFGLAEWAQYYALKLNVKNSMFLNNELYQSGNSYYGLLCEDLTNSNIDQSVFINNSDVFRVNNWYDVNIRNNLFIDNDRIFSMAYGPMWEGGTVSGNYFGTNDTSYINNNILPRQNDDVNFYRGTHTYLSIDGNRTFSEDDVQEYDIYFTGNVPAYETVISYTSNHSTIDTIAINILSTKTTVRVLPKGYGLETLVIEPNLYVMPINITKSTKVNYNVEVDAPETQYSIPLVITVNVKDEDNNTVTTAANVTINGTTETINIDGGVGTLIVNDLIPGKYDITTKIISNMNNYRNTTIYSSTNITTANAVITLSLNTTESIAREKVAFTIKTQNIIGNDISTAVYLLEDGIEVGSTDTDINGNAIYYYAPEAGNHAYTVRTHDEGYWKSAESNQVDLYVTTKKPTKLTISSDIDMITDLNQKATITSRLTDEDDNPLRGVEVNLVANDIVVDTKTTDDNGECQFEFTNTSNLYHVKTVYNGNLTYYDNSSDVLNIIVSTGGAFFDLSILINVTEENGVLTLIRNFTFDEILDQDFVNGIPIDKNITINGNGFTVDALSKARIFNIGADNASLNNLNIVNATSSDYGAAILFNGETLTVSNSKFRNNNVNVTKPVSATIGLGGGAIYTTGVLNVYNSTFEDNNVLIYNNISSSVSHSGGGAILTNNDLKIYNSVFDSNIVNGIRVNPDEPVASTNGASVYIIGGDTEIHNSTFSNGLASYAVVCYDNQQGNLSIYDSFFVNNSATYGGAISVFSDSANFINATFENNSAIDLGGAISSQVKNTYIKESKFINNSANLGGAIYDNFGNFIIEKSFFINNKAQDGASIIYFPDYQLNFRYNIVVNNTADIASGVFYDKEFDEGNNLGNLNYDYWGNNTPYDGNIFNEYIDKTFDYITIEIIGENVTYNTIPTEYLIKFNGTNADKLPDFETLIDALAKSNVNIDKTSIVINSTGAKVILTSDEVQNITLVVGPEYNILAYFNITVKQLIKKNYTSNIIFSGDTYGDTLIATIDIFDENGNQTGINGPLTYTFNGKTENATVKNGKAVIPLGQNDAGEYNITFTYNSTDLFYNDLTANKTFSISKANMTFTLDVNNATYGEDVNMTATPKRGVTGDFIFYIENELNQTVRISAGKAIYTLSDLAAGNYTLIVTYNGNNNYNALTVSRNFTVSKASSKVEISIDDVNYGDEIIAFVTGENIIGNVTITVNNKTYAVEIRNNSGNVTIDRLNAGKYNASVVYDGNSNITGSSNATQFEVFKASSNMTVDIGESILGHNTTVTVKFSECIEGTVTVTVDGKDHELPIKDGIATLNLTDLAEGNHTVSVKYPGSENYNSSEFNSTFSTKSLTSKINVTSSDITYGENLIVKATVNVDATGNVEFSINNVTKTAAIKEGVAEVLFEGLGAGTYDITAKYLGDSTYISSTNTTSAKVSKANSAILIIIGEIKDGENVVIKFNVSSDATGTITVEIPGLYSSRNRTLTNGANTWTISPLKPGTYTLNVIYNGDKNYLASSNSAVLIAKAYPVINMEVSESVVGKDAVINVELPENATGSVLITVDGIKYNRTLENGKSSVAISNVTKGTHEVDVLYSGDIYYYSTTNSTSFEPKQLDSHLYLLASDVEFGQDLVVRAVVDSDATGTVTFTVNGITQAVQIHQGFAAATYSNLNASAYDVKATYSGNDVYSSSSNTTRANVLKANSTVLIKVGEIKEGQNVRITITVSKSATGNITVEIPGLYSQRVRQLSNNQNIWLIAPLDAGLYEVKVAYPGDNNYYGSSNSTSIDYNRVKTTLNVDAIPSKNNIRLVANLTAEDGQLITAWVNVDVNGTAYRIPVFNGTGYLDLGKLEGGDYMFEAFYAGTRAIINSTDGGKFTVVPVIPILNVSGIVKYYGGSERLYVYLKDNYNDPISNATVVININGYDYERKTNANGTTSIALNLNSGEHVAAVAAGQYNLTSNVTVTILSTVNGTDVVKVYRNATQYYATFRDSEGNYLKEGTMVKFNINGVFYERKISGDKGMAKLNLNLVQGEYILTAMNSVTGENAVNNITIISRIIENYDITKYFRNGTQYTVKILGDDGKPVGAGETITFNINGVMYTRTTNASGIAKLNINLNPGTYIITGEYAGCKVSNTIKVLPILTAKDLAKKYGTSNPFVAKLVDGQGNPYAGQTITFNINGVFYNRVTDNAGQAKLNINLQAGQYIITSSYNAASLSNKVTITP